MTSVPQLITKACYSPDSTFILMRASNLGQGATLQRREVPGSVEYREEQKGWQPAQGHTVKCEQNPAVLILSLTLLPLPGAVYSFFALWSSQSPTVA